MGLALQLCSSLLPWQVRYSFARPQSNGHKNDSSAQTPRNPPETLRKAAGLAGALIGRKSAWICRLRVFETELHDPLAMQKVVGSSPIIRFFFFFFFFFLGQAVHAARRLRDTGPTFRATSHASVSCRDS